MSRLFCFGLGYTASFLARELQSEGWHIAGTARTPDAAAELAAGGYEAFVFDSAGPAISAPVIGPALAGASHVLVSTPPDADGDPILRHFSRQLAAAPAPRWIGYLSTIGVYGDHQGGWVDETTPPDRSSARAQRRIAAEDAWLALGERTGVKTVVFRLAGIYGPGRSALDKLRAGTAQRIIKPGQVFNRIHVDDIARALKASMAGRGTYSVYNVADNEPAPPQDVVNFAAQLLQMLPPPEIDFEAANLSPMSAAFYGENRRARNVRLRNDLSLDLKFPSYREGLRAILTASV
jgi:nucleoside-diphosphate-sugar epimerase